VENAQRDLLAETQSGFARSEFVRGDGKQARRCMRKRFIAQEASFLDGPESESPRCRHAEHAYVRDVPSLAFRVTDEARGDARNDAVLFVIRSARGCAGEARDGVLYSPADDSRRAYFDDGTGRR